MEELRESLDLDDDELRLRSEELRFLNLSKNPGDFLGCLVSMSFLFLLGQIVIFGAPKRSSPLSALFSRRKTNKRGMFSGWMSSLAQGNEGLWPKDKPGYDSMTCELQGPSQDTFDAGGAKTIVRTSSSEGTWDNQEDCCRNRCGNKDFECPSACTSSEGRGGGGGTPHHGHHKDRPHRPHCVSHKGYQYCGEDCDQARKDGFGCWSEKDCSEVTGEGVSGQRYFAKLAQCCVEYTALNGQRRQNPAFDEDTSPDDTLQRCADDPEFQSRQTDYPIQEPACSGGYEDRGEFPSPSHPPRPLPPCPGPPPGSDDPYRPRLQNDPRTAPKTLHKDAPPRPQVRPGTGSPPHRQEAFGMHRHVTAGMRGSPRSHDGAHGPRGLL